MGVHWQQQPTDLAAGQVETIDVYAASDPSIDVVYQGARSGVVFTLDGYVPAVGPNVARGSATQGQYRVLTRTEGGYNPTHTYDIQFGKSFAYSGHTETFTIPAGISELDVSAVGGAGGYPLLTVSDDGWSGPSTPRRSVAPVGAQVTGVLPVSTGEVLTIAVGGNGQSGIDKTAHGGWSVGGYGGGEGAGGGSKNPAAGGGGATVITDSGGRVLLVAGGGGGSYGTQGQPDPARLIGTWYPNGGRGGPSPAGPYAGESGTGAVDDTPAAATGGQAGGLRDAAVGTHGMDATASSGGAGGGGATGGAAGPRPASGGGAGSSAAPGLSTASVAAGPAAGWNHYSQLGGVEITLH
ncbi:glycine-rich protein [Motilibacter aurantiacus]|uniref:glycine-rich protein n=1 Tax=Motilibacter aurantiacus TaxID=2714955 RepID=UPI00140E3830|nr:glycine-rich protein [Motilibacter aurantiacus]NHC47640.1 hypothetical protein [Motilibacter aurantiacus]